MGGTLSCCWTSESRRPKLKSENSAAQGQSLVGDFSKEEEDAQNSKKGCTSCRRHVLCSTKCQLCSSSFCRQCSNQFVQVLALTSGKMCLHCFDTFLYGPLDAPDAIFARRPVQLHRFAKLKELKRKFRAKLAAGRLHFPMTPRSRQDIELGAAMLADGNRPSDTSPAPSPVSVSTPLDDVDSHSHPVPTLPTSPTAAAARGGGGSGSGGVQPIGGPERNPELQVWYEIMHALRTGRPAALQQVMESKRPPLSQLEFYVPQVTHLVLTAPLQPQTQEDVDPVALAKPLEDMISQACSQSMHFALKMYFHLEAFLDPKATSPTTAAASVRGTEDRTLSDRARKIQQMCRSMAIADRPVSSRDSRPAGVKADGEGEEKEAADDNVRSQYFDSVVNLVMSLCDLSDQLRSHPKDRRNAELRSRIKELNKELARTGVYLPLWKLHLPHYRILHIPPEDAFTLSSAEKVPYMFHLEVLETHIPNSSSHIHAAAVAPVPEMEDTASPGTALMAESVEESATCERRGSGASDGGMELTTVMPRKTDGNLSLDLKLAVESNQQQQLEDGEETPRSFDSWEVIDADETNKIIIDGEVWQEKAGRLRSTSGYGYLDRWNLKSVIVKAGDDCRQEALAMQFLQQVLTILREGGVDAWLQSYQILVTSSQSGLFETVPNVVSIDTIKKKTPHFTSLANYFKTYYGGEGSETWRRATRCFVESMAGSSLLCYLLQVKDRHNGNILLDADGHVIHIDFGFMLTSSPGGNMNFEKAPFKLTSEFLEVMGGRKSENFAYFKELCVRGFLELRQHYEKLVILIDMIERGSNLQCFRYGQTTAAAGLLDRLKLELPEQESAEYMASLISRSCNNWRSGTYDLVQRVSNGIR